MSTVTLDLTPTERHIAVTDYGLHTQLIADDTDVATYIDQTVRVRGDRNDILTFIARLIEEDSIAPDVAHLWVAGITD